MLLLTIDSLVSYHSLWEHFVGIAQPFKIVYFYTGMGCVVIINPASGQYTEDYGILCEAVVLA
jgi:hypothetical protein